MKLLKNCGKSNPDLERVLEESYRIKAVHQLASFTLEEIVKIRDLTLTDLCDIMELLRDEIDEC